MVPFLASSNVSVEADAKYTVTRKMVRPQEGGDEPAAREDLLGKVELECPLAAHLYKSYEWLVDIKGGRMRLVSSKQWTKRWYQPIIYWIVDFALDQAYCL